MKKLLSVLLVALLAFGILSAGAETIRLQLNDTNTAEHPTGIADKYFADLVKERTNGRIEIEVFTGGTLYGSEPEAIEALSIGELAFARVASGPVAEFAPELGAFQMPYIFKGQEHMWAVLDGEIGQGILDAIQASGSGMIGLCFYDSGSRSFYTKEPVTVPDDLAGKKIRMMDNRSMVHMTELLGATPVVGIGPSDIFGAITTGTIDGAENNYTTYYTKGDYKAANYYVVDGHLRTPEVMLASEAALKNAGLNDDDVQLLKEIAKETTAYQIDVWNELEVTYKQALLDDGVVVTALTTEQIALYQEKDKPMWEDPEYGAKYADIIEKIEAVGEGL